MKKGRRDSFFFLNTHYDKPDIFLSLSLPLFLSLYIFFLKGHLNCFFSPSN